MAEANQRRTQLDVDRYTPLAEQQAITQQDLDNATQNNMAAKATVQSAHAQVETTRAQIMAAEAAVQSAKASVEAAQINLGFTRITAPIDGIPGIAQQQVGALVSPASGAITTMSTLDPIKVYFTVSEQEYLDFTRRFPTAQKRQADLSQLPLSIDSRGRNRVSASREIRFCEPPGGCQDWRHPRGGIVPQSGE